MIDYAQRLKTFREKMAERGWGAALLTPSGDAEYLLGIRRQRPHATEHHMHGDWLYGVLVTPSACVAITPYLAESHIRQQIQDKPWITNIERIGEGQNLPELVRRLADEHSFGSKTLAIPGHAPAQTALALKQYLPAISFASTADLLAPWRAIKEPEEIKRMQKAAEITDQIFEEVLNQLQIGMTEQDIMLEIEHQMLAHGAEGPSFVTGVMIRGGDGSEALEGIRRAGSVQLLPNRTLAFDFGIVHDGYVSDFGRTVYCGEPDSTLQNYHQLVIDAQTAGIEALRPDGITTEAVDRAARDIIESAGLGEHFFHRLGHGIGIDVHESPFLALGDTTPVAENMCFTVEPSLYLPNRCFIRVEDVVVVTPSGGRALNAISKEMIVI